MEEIRYSCPQCGQHYKSPVRMAGEVVRCQNCHKSFHVPSLGTTMPSDNSQETTPSDTLDATNDLLERAIGYVVHAIWGIFRRVGQIIRWIYLRICDFVTWLFRLLRSIVEFFFSLRFLKFLVLLVVLSVLCVILLGIVVAPFFLTILFAHGVPLGMTMQTMWSTLSGWCRGIDVPTKVYNCAWMVEIAWFVLIAGWGIWKGMKSYKYGIIARWRERRRSRKAKQRAAREAAPQVKK